MIFKYLASLGIVVLVVSLAASRLGFVQRSEVLNGASQDETFRLEFTIEAESEHSYIVDDAVKRALEKGITFPTEGVVHINSSSVQITPKDVSWYYNSAINTEPGAALAARVKWVTPKDAPKGAHASIFIQFPDIPDIEHNSVAVHNGSYKRDDQDRYVLREVTTFPNATALFLVRSGLALAVGLPIGALLHTFWLEFLLSRERRSRLAALPPQRTQLPRTFYPNPIAEWTVWSNWLSAFSCFGSIFAGLAIYKSFFNFLMPWFVYGAVGLGALLGLILAYFRGKQVLTVIVKPDGISYARGRGNLQWQNARWADVSEFTEKSGTHKSHISYISSVNYMGYTFTRNWLEVVFRDDRKKLKITKSIEDYAALRDLLFSFLPPKRSAIPGNILT